MHRTLRPLAVTAVVIVGGLASVPGSVPEAAASPPSGFIRIRDIARVQVADGASLHVGSGTTHVTALYALPPGATTGWRSQPGQSLLAVAAGTMTLTTPAGCTAKTYPAGQGVVVPAGPYEVSNAGTEPLRFAGAFVDLASAEPRPLEGPSITPAPCPQFGAFAVAGPEVADLTVGVYDSRYRFPSGHAEHAGHAEHSYDPNRIDVPGGRDLVFEALEFDPGASTGWVDHKPALATVTRAR